ncbi:MAG TPA: flagellar basal body-associated FliL family protein [Syntrophorhabdaceae bacterium]|nr:flagellar basal body-associated FliL family protein [Syntrophorhabdaceae bacterium]
MDEEKKELKTEEKKGEKPEKQKKPEAKPVKKGKMKLIFFIIVLVFCGAIGGGYFMYGDVIMKKYLGGQEEGQAEAKQEKDSKKKNGGVGPILALEPFVFNLSGSSAKFARVSLGIEVKDPKIMEEAKKMVPAIRDRTLSVLGTKVPEALMDVGQRNEIKKEIYASLKDLFKNGEELRSVYITDIIVQ